MFAVSINWLSLPEETSMIEAERGAALDGFRCIAGADEAGRGPLAGPLVGAAVVLGEPVPEANDSKLLNERQREQLFARIMEGPHRVAVTVVESDEIDRYGIQRANYRALSESAERVDADFVLFDGFNIPGCSLPQRKMVKGDRRSMTIAAASIIAKVTRDRIMVVLDARYPEYGFAAHKGYGTRRHLDAIAEYGPCLAHRCSFAPIAQHPATEEMFATREGR